jgi:hypothetical protein
MRERVGQPPPFLRALVRLSVRSLLGELEPTRLSNQPKKNCDTTVDIPFGNLPSQMGHRSDRNPTERKRKDHRYQRSVQA